jgi:L-alanine-DL-glutamate epimerase-like enolase superfamily enzyme
MAKPIIRNFKETGMKIAQIKAINLRIPYKVPFRPAHQPGRTLDHRNFTLVIIRTEDGTTGYAGTDGHHASKVARLVEPYLIGVPIHHTEDHARIFRNAEGLWFLDMAIWDIIGKLANKPTYQIWGAARDKVQAYASAPSWWTPDQIPELMERYKSDGIIAVKLRIHNETMKEDLAVVDAGVKATPDITIMVDCNQANRTPAPKPHPYWDYQRAYRTCRELEQRNVYWIEEPFPRGQWHDYARLSAETEIYVTGGETSPDLFTFRDLIEKRVYNIIQPDPIRGEGISQMRKIAAMAEMYNIPCMPHMARSGIGDAACLHLACSTPGLMWYELMYEPPSRDIETYQQLGGLLQSKIWIDEDGNVSPSDEPGFGIIVDESAIKLFEV